MMGDDSEELTIIMTDVALLCSRQRYGVCDHRVKHWLELSRRARDDAEDLACRCLLLERFGEVVVTVLQLLEQASVLNRNNRLIRKSRDQINLSGGKRTGVRSEDDDNTDWNTLSKQRHAKHRSEVHELLGVS